MRFDSGPEVFVLVNQNYVLTEYVLNENDCTWCCHHRFKTICAPFFLILFEKLPFNSLYKAKTKTETNFVVTVGFTTNVDHQTPSEMVQNQGRSSRFKGPGEKQGHNFGCAVDLAIEVPCALQLERRREKEEERKRKGKKEERKRKEGREKGNKKQAKVKAKKKKERARITLFVVEELLCSSVNAQGWSYSWLRWTSPTEYSGR